MLSALVICCIDLPILWTNVIIEANSVDPDQNTPTGSTLFDQKASKTFQQTTKVDDLL